MTAPNRSPRPLPSSTVQLSIIRLAMLSGVLMFGGVVWWLRRSGSATEVDAAAIANVRILAAAGLGVAVSGLVALYALTGRQADEARRRTFSIIAWAMGEGAALAGGVYYMFAGDPRWYLGGLFVLLVSFVLFPARRRD